MRWDVFFECVAYFLAVVGVSSPSEAAEGSSLMAVTVATEETDGLRRLRASAHTFGIPLHVFGVGEIWHGGDTRLEQGGGQKIRILKRSLEKYKDQENLIILFVDAYDVMFNGGEKEILEKFNDEYSEYRVLFSAEPFCWPDKELASKYPIIQFGKRYLNSGMFMGFAPEIWRILNLEVVEDKDDDQLYYTRIYLNEKIRKDLKITLDSMCWIFQNLNGVQGDIALEFDDGSGYPSVHNEAHHTHPLIVHGNGPSKLYLDHIGNYIAKSYSIIHGCRSCGAPITSASFKDSKDSSAWPSVTIAAFVSKPIPFVREFLDLLEHLTYPQSRIHLFIYNNQEYNKKDIERFASTARGHYKSVQIENVDSDRGEREARSFAFELAEENGSDFAFLVDGDVHLNNSDALRLLVQIATEQHLGVLAPLMRQPNNLFSNYWGALASDGYYARSDDYVDIVEWRRRGVWNVPFINAALLIRRQKFVPLRNAFLYNTAIDSDMSFCEFARHHGHFLYVDNEHYYGYLIVSDDFDTSKAHPEMYQIFDNRFLWESRYIHPSYWLALNGSEEIAEPCPDVFDFPFMSDAFCAELIEEMERFGKWSSGSNRDERLAGGYENVPTRDIHMNQIGFERHWLYLMDEYVRPIQEKIFIGYFHKPVESSMMFVVRYRPEEQASLRPHHDASTYSIDVALNKRGVDYEGGGVRYVRYNCTVPADQVGYSMIFPGRLTHLHEGLPTTAGTRYIAVSFLNP